MPQRSRPPTVWPNGLVVQAPTLCQCGQWHVHYLSPPRPLIVAVGRRIREETNHAHGND